MATATPTQHDRKTPQVLLFGHTGSGKSSLLGALLKAGETQGPTLRGEVLESSGRLASLRDAVYRGDNLEADDAEITSYTVRLRPWRNGTKTLTDPLTLIIHDCAGTAAASLMEHPETIAAAGADASVARAVIDADAIVLLVDGASDSDELQEAFEEFDTFLTIVAQAKANAREVGGCPILLALTHCDKLAKPGDTLHRWEVRVKDRAERAWDKFTEFLKTADEDAGITSPFFPFGSIDLSVYAVAIRFPKLADIAAQPNVPYGVAELFRDCFAAARSHRDRVKASDRRLKWTVRLALGFAMVLLIGAIGVGFFRPPLSVPDLTERVIGYQLHEPEAKVRLSYPYLTRNKDALSRFRDDPAFGALPEDLRAFVIGRLKEIEDYERFRSQLVGAVAPADVRTLDDLKHVEERLNGELGLPSNYGWSETLAAQLREKWLADVSVIRDAEARFYSYYREFVRRGEVQATRTSLGENWRNEVNALIAEAAHPPAVLTDPISGSPTLDQPRGEPVLNRVPFEFERPYNARKDWESTRENLTHLRDLADALGLTAGPDRPAVLVLPEPASDVDSTTLPGNRWAALLRTFPSEPNDFRNWEVNNFADPARKILAERLDHSFDTGSQHVKKLLRTKIGQDAEASDTPTGWRAVADWLGDPTSPYPEWGRFLQLLARLRATVPEKAANPVGELAAFLRQDKFALDLRGFDVFLHRDLSSDKPVPAGPLVVTLTPRNGVTVTKEFKQSGSGSAGDSGTTYRFVPETDGKLTYVPGDELHIGLPVKAGNQEFKLVWERTGSKTYQFDRFMHEPRMMKAGSPSQPAAGVRLAPTPGTVLPQLPPLFPEVKR